jgi:two-component system response regulator (stage 0 sporulation protein F)
MEKSPKDFKIGIADGHIQTAIGVSEVLENEGFKTFQAYNGQDTIKICKNEKIDILIMGAVLDGMTGYQVAEALPNQKIFLICDPENAKKMKNIVAYIQKPVDDDELIKTLRKYLKIK